MEINSKNQPTSDNIEIFFIDNFTSVINAKILDNDTISKPFSPDPLPGFKFGSFRLEKFLGEGNFGVVYLVSGLENPNEYFALKILKLWDVIPEERKITMQRFLSETQFHLKINSQYLVPLIKRGLVNGNPFFIMKFCPNGDLRSKIKNQWNENDSKKLAFEILGGLKSLHDRKIIHRDLKPENVLFDEQNQARLTDFGIAGDLNNRLTKRSGLGQKIMGTYIYIPPEHFKSSKPSDLVGPAMDIFAFGVVFYEVLTSGKLPYGNPEKDFGSYYMRSLKGEIIPLKQAKQDTPQLLVDIVHRCLQSDPKKRFSNVDEIISILQK